VIDDLTIFFVDIDQSCKAVCGWNDHSLQSAGAVDELESRPTVAFARPEKSVVSEPTWYVLMKVDPGVVVFGH
jgi:hypothetical protein